MAVVTAPSLVVAGGGSPDADAPLIGYENLFASASVTASSAAGNKPIALALNTNTAQRWEGSSAADQTITVELSGLDDVEYIGLAAHNLGTLGATISVEGALTLDTAEDPEYSDLDVDTIPGDDCALLLRFTKAAYLFIRISIDLPTSATVAPFIGILYGGEFFKLMRNIYVGHTPITYGRNSTVNTGVSENGQYLGRVQTRGMLKTSVQMSNLTPEWYRANMEPFAKAAVTDPFFWAWRPFTYPNEVAFGWLTGDVKPSNEKPNGYMAASFEVEAIGC